MQYHVIFMRCDLFHKQELARQIDSIAFVGFVAKELISFWFKTEGGKATEIEKERKRRRRGVRMKRK